MSVHFSRRAVRARRLLGATGILAALLATGGCSSITESTRSALDAITPYKVEVVQGNFVSKEQVAALKPGMTRQQVREILGTPLLTDVFHADRWDYVFTIKRKGVQAQQRHLTVYFDGERMARVEGDEMPSEEDFVATLDTHKKSGKVPVLEATPEQLEKFKPEKPKDQAKPQAAASAPLPAAYPPLESR